MKSYKILLAGLLFCILAQAQTGAKPKGKLFIIGGSKAMVVGERQVVVMKKPEGLKVVDNGLVKLNDLQLGIYTAGDEFKIGPK